MSKTKSIFVTAVMAVMLALILVGLHQIEPKAHTALTVLLAVYGFLCGAMNLCGWLQKGEPAEPKHLETVEADPFARDSEDEDGVKLFEADRIRFENVRGE